MALLEDRRHLRLPLALVVLVGFLLLIWQVAELTRNSALESLRAEVDTTLARYSLTLEGELEKYRSLPALLATNDAFARVLSYPQDELLIDNLNRYLARLALLTGASDIYLMASTGVTLAASNWNSETSFIGRNFSYRPYFQQAMMGNPGQYFALGSTSRKRGYFFSYPIYRNTGVIGVVVVKIDINDIEQQWSDPLTDLLVTDIDDVVFISTRKEWKFKSLQTLGQVDLQRIEKSLRYGDTKLTSLPVVKRESIGKGAELFTLIEREERRGEGLSAGQYLSLRQPLPGTELNVVAMARLDSVQRQVWNSILLGAGLFVIALLGLMFFALRRRIYQERQRFKLQATRALEVNEARVRAIIDNTQAGLITLDAQGRIETINPTAEAQFGYEGSALSGCYFSQLISEADRALCWRMITEPASPSAALGRQVPVVEACGKRRDGISFPIELTIVAMEPQGERKFIVTIHDISVRKAYEEDLRQARDLLESRVEERTRDLRHEIEEHRRTQEELIQTAKMAVLGELSAGINHELNQPLTAIRAYADNATAFLQRQRVDRVAENLVEIAGLTERMAKIIAPLKVFSRKTSGQVEPVALKSVCEGAMTILFGRLQGCSVEVLWPEGIDDLYVMGDMVRLEQVVVNLIGNAVQAMENQPQGVVRVSVDIGLADVRIHFHDSGPGIAAKDPNKVFEPFYTTKKREEGLGLGLSISHRIVESLGGSLIAANHSDGGAIFTLQLNRAPEQSPAESLVPHSKNR